MARSFAAPRTVLKLDATQALASLFGAGALLCLLVVLLPHDPVLDTTGVLGVGGVAALAAVGLAAARRACHGAPGFEWVACAAPAQRHDAHTRGSARPRRARVTRMASSFGAGPGR